ncbi:uncharacterized protein LOC120270109 [Dioscorea cayenensis subsp. rotundata]|uniref:Uncharacterized protein LOC120270109 n=1 Tax=Dioscorea cayennensis subsp. rotundata TaxID=55577 RepID=A0AB40C028_DIOCR|nr:uncharacterized protein LOC120270109 [Dioscorea cayenensis subsp. rotundata]
MDQTLIDTLLEVVLVGPRRTESGFKADECTKVVNKVLERCQVVLIVVHVRARMKTLKIEFKEITELFMTSGFGLDANGQITADPLVWEKHLQDNPNANNLKGKLCPRYYDLLQFFAMTTQLEIEISRGMTLYKSRLSDPDWPGRFNRKNRESVMWSVRIYPIEPGIKKSGVNPVIRAVQTGTG